MTKTTAEVSKDNYVPVEESKLKEEQKAELDKAMEMFKRECLKSFSATRAGEVIEKFDFPALQPLTEVQRENRMLDMVCQAMGHAFVNHAPVMTNTVHNAVIKTLSEGTYQGYTGPCYQQPGLMNFTPVGSATVTSPSALQGGNNSSTAPQPMGTTLPAQFNLVFTNSPLFITSVQGGSSSGLTTGWDPVTGFGMPPNSFTPSTLGQNSTSASQTASHQQNESASQPMVQNVSVSQPMSQTNTSVSQPMSQQQHTASLIQPITPTEVLVSRLPHRNSVDWVFHDTVDGTVRHVNVPYAHPLAQQSIGQTASQPSTTNVTP